jgi:hypothetical protein
MVLLTVALVLAASGLAPDVVAQDATIVAHAKQHGPCISRYMTGACIEDVNHEIYGGLYSQMIFGESFQEPAESPADAVRGFTAYGGSWRIEHGEFTAAAGPGPKLIADRAKISAGEVGVEVLFPDAAPGNAGLIVRVADPGEGADKFTGYEIALVPEGKSLCLGRHRQNWEPIRYVPCSVPVGQWIPLSVKSSARVDTSPRSGPDGQLNSLDLIAAGFG